MNDGERSQWVDNDEGLYRWWRGSRMSKRAFIRENRRLIDDAIHKMTTRQQPTHYLAYPERMR